MKKNMDTRKKNKKNMDARSRPVISPDLRNLISECRKDNRRFYNKVFNIRQRELAEVLRGMAGKVRRGRLVPLSITQTDITAATCQLLDREAARIAVATFRSAVKEGDPDLYKEVLRRIQGQESEERIAEVLKAQD